ncbi:MAG: MBL fold metallo-hydrolase [Bdellovibrionota bacterium]
MLVVGELRKPIVYGGNTPCVEVCSDSNSLIVDMGSGLRDLGTAKLGRRSNFNVFLTHLHMDHISGLPFFVPVFMKGTHITIYHVHKLAPKIIKNLFDGITFPLKWGDLDAKIEFKRIEPYEKVQIENISISPFCLDHPGGSFGYRFEGDNQSIVVGFDGEFKRQSREELGKDLPYYQNVDLIAFDAQYEPEELVNRFDWGHCSAPIGIDLAIREGIKKLVLFHHDPWASEVKLDQYFRKSKSYLNTAMQAEDILWPHQDLPEGPELQMAYDGLEIDLGKKGNKK